MSLSRVEWLALALLATIAAAGGYWLKSTDMPRPEIVSAAPAVRQGDGSLVAERQPVANPPAAPHTIPKGAKEERRVAIVVKPKQAECDPVHVNLSLVEQDGGRRVVASSPDGDIVSALDIPITAALVAPPARPWAAGASYSPMTQRAGVWIERDLARLRIGADLVQEPTGQLAVVARVGWRW